MGNGPDRETAPFEGSILFSTILLFLLGSFLMLSVLESYRLTSDIGLRTKNFYIAKTMKEMFLADYSSKGEQPIEGKQRYTTGQIVYHKRDGELKLVISVSPFEYTFFENVEARKKEEGRAAS